MSIASLCCPINIHLMSYVICAYDVIVVVIDENY
jgi:hypothetical protein